MNGLWAFLLDSMGSQEMLIVGVLAILLFGERLPEIGRKVGKSLTEFKRNIRGIQEEFTGALTGVDNTINSSSSASSYSATRSEVVDDGDEATAPKFVPPPRPPQPPQA